MTMKMSNTYHACAYDRIIFTIEVGEKKYIYIYEPSAVKRYLTHKSAKPRKTRLKVQCSFLKVQCTFGAGCAWFFRDSARFTERMRSNARPSRSCCSELHADS